jgi:hypothetical protein
MTDQTGFMKLDTIAFSPSIVFEFIDHFTSDTVRTLSVSIVNGPAVQKKPVQNATGYVLFYGLPDGTYTFRAEAAGFDVWEQPLIVATGVPVPQQIRLIPSASYVFPAHATLVRGMVQPGTIAFDRMSIILPIKAGALLSTISEKGEFFFYVSSLSKDNKTESGGTWFVKATDNTNVLGMQMNVDGATASHTIVVDPLIYQKTSSQFLWEIGKEVHIRLTFS